MSNYHDTILSFSTIILSACLSYITARLTSQSEYKKSVLDTVYKKVVYPIYITIYADIKRYKSDSSFEPTLKQIQTIKNKIMNILKNSEGAYTDKFYSRCKDLSPTNYKSFCEYIERNYHECVYKLDYYLPYGYFGKEKNPCSHYILNQYVFACSFLFSYYFRTQPQQKVFSILNDIHDNRNNYCNIYIKILVKNVNVLTRVMIDNTNKATTCRRFAPSTMK